MSKETHTYKQKQEWLERVMAASDLTPATKVFAFAIYKRMFGKKVTSNPTEAQITEDTGLNRSKFNDYRMSLEGALTMTKGPSSNGGRDRYTYTLVLDWQSNVPTGDIDTVVEPESNVPSGDNQCTQRGQSMYPVGTINVPRGDANTTSNTSSKTLSKTTRAPAEPVATASASTTLLLDTKQGKLEDLEALRASFDHEELKRFRELTSSAAWGGMKWDDAVRQIIKERNDEQW